VAQVAVCSQINTKMQCGQSVHLLNVKLLLHHVTSRLLKVKERSCNNCCRRIVIFFKYSEHVFVNLVIRHEEHKCGIILSHFFCPIVPYYFTLFLKGHDFRRKFWSWNVCPDFPHKLRLKYVSVFGRSCDRPPRHRFFLVSLRLKVNAEMFPKITSCHYVLFM